MFLSRKNLTYSTVAAGVSSAMSSTMDTASAEWASAEQTRTLGWLPWLAAVSAIGLLLNVIGNLGAYTTQGWAEPLFWLGLLLIVAPTVVRLASSEASGFERIALVGLSTTMLYLVKVVRSPFAFTFGDEFLHYYNARMILRDGVLFTDNPLLQASAFYPGLEIVTAAISSLTGLSIFYAGMILIGVARLVGGLGIYLLAERLSNSARVAGLTVAIYWAQSNYLFWSAQYSYESLSLPMFVALLYLIIRREDQGGWRNYIGYKLLILLAISAIAVTHHITSFFMVAFFVTWALVNHWQLHRWCADVVEKILQWGSRTPLGGKWAGAFQRTNAHGSHWSFSLGVNGIAIFAMLATLIWLIFVASITVGYLSPVLGKAVVSLVETMIGTEGGRQLFVSYSGYVAPLLERMIGVGSVILSLLGLPFGLYQFWRNYSQRAFTFLLACASVSYFALLTMRFSSASWETGNRASAFLYVGLAFILALGIVEFWSANGASLRTRILIASYISILFIGGVIAGWAPTNRLTKPYVVAAGDQIVAPQGVATTNWMRSTLGTGKRMAIDDSNGRLMLAYGEQYTLAQRQFNMFDLLPVEDFGSWQVKIIQMHRVRYALIDRRLISADVMQGYYFDPVAGYSDNRDELYPPEVYTKWDRQEEIDRVYDSGNIVIYDVGRLQNIDPLSKDES
jgi:hypothetical protein